MRILFLGNFEGRGWDGSVTDENHIAKALEDLGHEVHRVQRETAYDDVPGNPVYDFVLVAQWDGYEDRLFKMLPHPRVYWAFDYQADGQEWHEFLIKNSDLYLSKRITDSKYPNWQWMYDFAPDFLTEGTGNKDIDVLFTGSYLPWATERNETIKAVGEKFNLVIHSVNEWPQGNEGPVMDEGLIDLYARARIVLSIDHTLEAGYWSDRNAQAMACGAFVLYRYVPMSEVVFKNHVAYFYSVEDCLRKIEALLNPQMIPIRAEVSRGAYEYAQGNLMVKNRVMDLLTIVENHLENRLV